MSRLLYTSNIPFDMNDWNEKQIKDIFAGKNCIMAITESGETLQKISNQEFMSRTQYWTRIKQIGISKWAEGAAIGLVEDGTCLIAKRPIRLMCEDRRLNFEHINDTVKSWKNVVQVAASDAFFALRADGTIRYVSFCERYQAEYEEIKEWREVIRIVTGVQNSIFGITKNGEILAAGTNAMNIKNYLSKYDNVVDVYPIGSECTDMYVLTMDGSVARVREDLNNLNISNKLQRLDGHFDYKAFALTESQSVIDISDHNAKSVFPEKNKIVSFAVGDSNYTKPFVVALCV